MTLVEDEISSLANYFGSSCMPGPWTADLSFDSHLSQWSLFIPTNHDNPFFIQIPPWHDFENCLLEIIRDAKKSPKNIEIKGIAWKTSFITENGMNFRYISNRIEIQKFVFAVQQPCRMLQQWQISWPWRFSSLFDWERRWCCLGPVGRRPLPFQGENDATNSFLA